MKRILIIAFSLLVLMSMSSLATNTRVMTMGDNNTILLDEANIWQFPSRINDYPNLAIGEFGTPGDFMDLGIHWQFDEDNPWVLGTYLHNSDVYDPGLVPFDDPDDPDSVLLSNRRIDLFYGKKLGVQAIPFGFHLGLIHSSQKAELLSVEMQEGLTVYDFSAGLTLSNGMTDLSAGLMLMTWTDKDITGIGTTYDETKPKGNMQLYASGRHFWQVTPPYTVTPHASLVIGKNEAEFYELNNAGSDSLAYTDKYNYFGFEIGSGLQYAPSNDATAVIDVGLQIQKLDEDLDDSVDGLYEASDKITTIPFFRAGADLKVFNWMDVRFGATSFWNRESYEFSVPLFPAEEYSANYADNATYLGFGFHWGNLHVDTYTDPELFLNGFDFISGGGSGNMNFQISALYEIM